MRVENPREEKRVDAMRSRLTMRFDSMGAMDAPRAGREVRSGTRAAAGFHDPSRTRGGMTPMMIFISAPYVCHGGRAVQKRRPGSAPRMSVGGPEKARRNFFISAYVVGCGAPLREGKFFISERVAWDMGRGARKNNPRRCVWVRPGARACLQAWRGVAWRYVACLGFLGFRVQARHGKLHAQLAAACMHTCAPRTHARRPWGRPPGRPARPGNIGHGNCSQHRCEPVRGT